MTMNTAKSRDTLKAGDLMDSAIVTLRRNTRLSEIYAVMSQSRQSDFPVVDEKAQLVGMLYEENIRKALKDSYRSIGGDIFSFSDAVRRTSRVLKARADEMMTPETGWVSTETEICKIAAVMEDKNVRCLPVFGEGRVLGLISIRTILLGFLKYGLEVHSSSDAGSLGAVNKNPVDVERRRHPRKPAFFKLAYKPVAFDVEYSPTDVYGNTSGQQARIAHCQNLSLGGMLIHAPEELNQDDVLELVFEIPASTHLIRRLARVTRSAPAPEGGFHFGLMFLALSVQETTALSVYLSSIPDQ